VATARLKNLRRAQQDVELLAMLGANREALRAAVLRILRQAGVPSNPVETESAVLEHPRCRAVWSRLRRALYRTVSEK
jgi:crotonobetainyl-CoA:carnitine CoA-transferase CaiB-like acyl-CoA transferase